MGDKGSLGVEGISRTEWLLRFQEVEANTTRSQDACTEGQVLARSPTVTGLKINQSTGQEVSYKAACQGRLQNEVSLDVEPSD